MFRSPKCDGVRVARNCIGDIDATHRLGFSQQYDLIGQVIRNGSCCRDPDMLRADRVWRFSSNTLLCSQMPLVVLAWIALCAFGASEIPHLQMRIAGHGPRTVVLAAGLGDTLDVWNTVQPLITDHCTRTIAYSRAGYPGSDDAAGGARDAATIVSELRAELKRRGVLPPYVLVGHSLGGLYMQYFARRFPAGDRWPGARRFHPLEPAIAVGSAGSRCHWSTPHHAEHALDRTARAERQRCCGRAGP